MLSSITLISLVFAMNEGASVRNVKFEYYRFATERLEEHCKKMNELKVSEKTSLWLAAICRKFDSHYPRKFEGPDQVNPDALRTTRRTTRRTVPTVRTTKRTTTTTRRVPPPVHPSSSTIFSDETTTTALYPPIIVGSSDSYFPIPTNLPRPTSSLAHRTLSFASSVVLILFTMLLIR